MSDPIGPREVFDVFAIITAGVVLAAAAADHAYGDTITDDPQTPWAECYTPGDLARLALIPGIGYEHEKPTPIENPQRSYPLSPLWLDGARWPGGLTPGYRPDNPRPGGGSVETPGAIPAPVPLPAIGGSLVAMAIGALLALWWRR